MIMPPRETIVQRGNAIVSRRQVYRLMRAVHRDNWLQQAIARLADPIASVSESIARSAGLIVQSSQRGRVRRTSRTRVAWVVRRDHTIARVGPRIAPTERLTRPDDWTIAHDSSAIVDRDNVIDRSARRSGSHGAIVRFDGRRYRSRVEVEDIA
jgi:histone H3/H4